MAQFRALFRRQLRDVDLAALHQPVAELLKPTLDVVRRVLAVPDSLLPFLHQRARQIAALFHQRRCRADSAVHDVFHKFLQIRHVRHSFRST